MKPLTGSTSFIRLAVLACLAAAPLSASLSWAAVTPEAEAARLARILKPVPDEEWKTVAGDRVSQKYEVAKGDTLFDISKRLFGDAKYWPKIWALNNGAIMNPHIIRPGNQVAFLPGTGTSLPSVAVNSLNDPTSAVPAPDAPQVERGSDIPAKSTFDGQTISQEWKGLPRQSWETVPGELPAEVDAQGFDKNNRVKFTTKTGFELEAIPASERIDILGKISGSRSEAKYLGIGDTVYISADAELQIGETYALTDEPYVLKSRKSDRSGLSYLVAGKVRVIGVKDGMFIGTVIAARHYVERGSMLMPMPKRIQNVNPIPGPSPIEGVLMMDRNLATYTVAQHKTVFVDRGSEDGIQPGMVFRAYQHFDPHNEKKITDSDFIIDADILVTQVSPKFCTGIIVSSLSPITENSSVVLLTDVTDLIKNRGFRDRSTEEVQRDQELDELDRLDGGPMGKDEEKELRQLEKWKENPPGDAATAPPTDPALPPTDGNPPPLPEDGLPPPPEGDALPPPPAEEGLTPPPPTADAPAPPPAAQAEVAPPPPVDAPPPATAEPPDSAELEKMLNQ